MSISINQILPIVGNARVVATITDAADLRSVESLKLLKPRPSLLEYRLDLLCRETEIADSTLLQQALGQAIPILLTARHPAEGGANDLTPQERAELVSPRLSQAAAIDIEIRSLKEEKAFWAGIREDIDRHTSPPVLIGSYHDFHSTPDLSTLKAVVQLGIDLKVDVVKIATFLQKPSDLATLSELLATTEAPLSVMGMGPLGPQSRLELAQAGSLLNYGYTETESAPGQMSAASLIQRLLDGTEN